MPTQIYLEYVDGVNWKLSRTISSRVVLLKTYLITVFAGFRTDGASIPRATKLFVNPFDQLWALASIVHDALYVCKCTSRKDADLIFYRLMSDNISNRFIIPPSTWRKKVGYYTSYYAKKGVAYAAYRSVRLGGWYYWNKDKSFYEKRLVQVNIIG